jgi:hypothetical protein
VVRVELAAWIAGIVEIARPWSAKAVPVALVDEAVNAEKPATAIPETTTAVKPRLTRLRSPALLGPRPAPLVR